MTGLTLCLHLLLSWLLCSAAVSHWNYQTGPQGPAAWDGPCQTGRSQSPINLQPEEAERVSFPPWQLRHYESLLKKAEVENNGHTLQLSPSKKEKKLPSVSGGGLEDKYIFAQLHLHWGNRSQVGSEHLVGGLAFPLELHLVHYNSKYSSLGEAASHPDGLAVLGVLHRLSAEDNPSLQPLVEAAESLTAAGQKTELARGISVKSLLPSGGSSVFYRYSGSLTTPGCNEVVTWTVLHHTATISEHQLNLLRSLTTGDSFKMGDNYRPVRPLNGRKVQLSGAEVTMQKEKEEVGEVVVLGPRMMQESQLAWEAGLVPGWAVVLISLAVGLNVGLAVWLVRRRRDQKYRGHSELPTEEQ